MEWVKYRDIEATMLQAFADEKNLAQHLRVGREKLKLLQYREGSPRSSEYIS